jgi:acetaldehyde dehydrogenase/alcohol dehydrogenase
VHAHAARIVLEAAVREGARRGSSDGLKHPKLELTSHLMSHKGINLILATGGPAWFKAAYSSGVPAIGVGAGNTPL